MLKLLFLLGLILFVVGAVVMLAIGLVIWLIKFIVMLLL